MKPPDGNDIVTVALVWLALVSGVFALAFLGCAARNPHPTEFWQYPENDKR